MVIDSKLYVHGGFDADKGLLADFNCIDISELVEEYHWTPLSNECEGEAIKLKSHTAVTHGGNIYLFGGEKNPINSSNLVFVYTPSSNQWRKVAPNIALPKMDSHAAIVHEGKMYVYGGYVPEEATYLTNMYAFDLEKETWEVYLNGSDGPNEPEGRSDFDMVEDEGAIWMFGGNNGKKNLDDFWKFSIK